MPTQSKKPKPTKPGKKKVKGKADVEVKPVKRNLQYRFTNDELLALGRQQAEAQQDLQSLENDRKQSADEWKSRISTKEAEITSLSARVSRGYEYRDIACELVINLPPGKKTVRRLDTGEVVSVDDLSEEEKQRTLKLEEAETPASESKEGDAKEELAATV